MKLFLFLAGLTVALAAPKYEPILTDYHTVVGIPEATRIRSAEAASDFDGAKIIGGSASSLGAHPHMGGLVIDLTTGGQSVCGSSLISDTRIATAAHCWRTRQHQATRFTVVLGSIRLFSGGTRITTSNIQMHASYDMDTLVNDVAIGTITRVGLNNNINTIPLATGSLNYVGWVATAAGFGRTGDNIFGAITTNQALAEVQLTVIANDVCARTYGPLSVIASTICTTGNNGRSTCGGDSGGPLTVVNNNQRQMIGITSFGHRDGCTRGFDVGFARVTSFASWFAARM